MFTHLSFTNKEGQGWTFNKTLQHLERFWYFDLLVNAGSCGVNQNSSVWMTTRPQRANTKKHWDLVGKGKFIPFHHTHLNHLHLVKRHVLKSGNQLTFTTIVPHCSSLSTTESNITKNKTKKNIHVERAHERDMLKSYKDLKSAGNYNLNGNEYEITHYKIENFFFFLNKL